VKARGLPNRNDQKKRVKPLLLLTYGRRGQKKRKEGGQGGTDLIRMAGAECQKKKKRGCLLFIVIAPGGKEKREKAPKGVPLTPAKKKKKEKTPGPVSHSIFRPSAEGKKKKLFALGPDAEGKGAVIKKKSGGGKKSGRPL